SMSSLLADDDDRHSLSSFLFTSSDVSHSLFFFSTNTANSQTYTLSLHDALPISEFTVCYRFQTNLHLLYYYLFNFFIFNCSKLLLVYFLILKIYSCLFNSLCS